MELVVLFLSAMMLCSCDLAVGDSPAQTLDVSWLLLDLQ